MLNWIMTYEDLLRRLDKVNQILSLKQMFKQVQFETIRLARTLDSEKIRHDLKKEKFDEKDIQDFFEQKEYNEYNIEVCPHCDSLAVDLGPNNSVNSAIEIFLCLNGHVYATTYYIE